MPVHPPRFARQQGAVLFVALVFLVLLTLLGLTAAGTSVLQERMTGGLRNAQLGLMGAESTVRGVEALLWNKSNLSSPQLVCGPTGGSDTCYTVSNLNAGNVTQIDPRVKTFRTLRGWPSSTGGDGAAPYAVNLTGLSGSQQTASLNQQPRYVIEDLGILLAPGVQPSCTGGAIQPCDTLSPGGQTLHLFRITGRATGGNNGSVATVESYFSALPPSRF